MNIPNPANTPYYWDEVNTNEYPWYKKGKCKRILRKRWIKNLLNREPLL